MRYILWSGGWDSTYLLCKWAMASDETIQPICMTPSGYQRVGKEREARWNILKLLRMKPEIKATINDPIEIAETVLPPSVEYDEAYKRAFAKYPDALSGMYRSLGRITILFPQPGIGVEAPAPGTRSNNIGKVEQLMLDNGLILDKDGKVTADKGDKDILKILGCYQYPLLHINEAQMLDEIKTWGYDKDVFQNTWSCYCDGSDGRKTCGVCRACDIKLMYGDTFKFMFDEKALKSHEIKEWLAKKGDKYAEYFKSYVMNGNWVMVEDDESGEKTKSLIQYFSYLEKQWPDVEGVGAPAL